MKPPTTALRWIVLVTVFSLFAPANPVLAQLGADVSHRFSPTAIYDNGEDSTTLEIYTGAGDIANVIIKPEDAEEPVYQLYDDGTNSDRAAGDGVYTLGGINTALFPDDLLFPIAYNQNNVDVDLATIWLSAEISYTTGQADTIDFMELVVISPQIVFPTEQVGNGIYATEYAFFMVDPAGETYIGNLTDTSDDDTPAIAKKFYSIYPDEFDIINYMDARGQLEIAAHSAGLRTPAENIGLDRTDYTKENIKSTHYFSEKLSKCSMEVS